MYWIRVCGIAAAILCAGGSWLPAAAQETVNLASISGRVVDPRGDPLPGADVVARQPATNITFERITGSDGRFRFAPLKVGTYEIHVRLDGFRPYSRSLTVTVGSAFDLPVQLTIDGVAETVTVTA